MQILWKRPFEQSDPIDTEGSGFYGRLHIFACQSPKWCRGLNLTLQLHLFFLLLPFIWLQFSYLFLQSLVYLRLYFCLPTLFSINKTKAKQTKYFPWFISLFIRDVHFEVSWGYSITQLEKKKSDKQVVQQKCGRLANKSLDRARSADIATIKRNARWLYIIWFKWLLQCTIDNANKWSGSFHFIIYIYEPVMWCGDEN